VEVVGLERQAESLERAVRAVAETVEQIQPRMMVRLEEQTLAAAVAVDIT
jgi:hypothetical protein